MTPLGALTADEFLRDHWQKKPLLIRQAFPGFTPELDADDIAGLACDELAEARLVSGSFPEHDWSLEHGPFEENRLRALPDSNWTLLVQDVEKHYPPLRSLLRAFGFLPRWRIDDLMVSVAAPGGSVGPHSDRYDVFLVQAAGQRRWQIAERFDATLLQKTELNVLKSFEPEQEWTLNPGDMLYLPPDVAHHGVALDAGMTWSIGMRAPSTADLLQACGEWLATEHDEGPRYTDPDLAPAANSAELDPGSLKRFAGLAAAASRAESGFSEFLGLFLSRYRLAHEPVGPDIPLSRKALARAVMQGSTLRQNPWTRLIWSGAGDNTRLYAAGSSYRCSIEFARAVCDVDALAREGQELAAANGDLLCSLVNDGHLYLEADE
ncbi:MAG: cupin domain-containing protein [Gammaproteobacteria bacterium]|nr:cupin domain-containing protein [Gammaproteobacteria bacterium]